MTHTFENQRDGLFAREPCLALVELYRHLRDLEVRVTGTPFPQPVVQGTRIMRIIALISAVPRRPATISYSAVRYAPALALRIPDFRPQVWLHPHNPTGVLGGDVVDPAGKTRIRQTSSSSGRSRNRPYATGLISLVALTGTAAVWLALTHQARAPAPCVSSFCAPSQQSPGSAASIGPSVAVVPRRPATQGMQGEALTALRTTASPTTTTSQPAAPRHMRKHHLAASVRPVMVPDVAAVHPAKYGPATHMRQSAARAVVDAFQHGRRTRTEVTDSPADITVERVVSRRETGNFKADSHEWMNHLSQRRITEIPDEFSE